MNKQEWEEVQMRLHELERDARPDSDYHEEGRPSPRELLKAAIEFDEDRQTEANLREYSDTIEFLRQQGHSWRKISEFLAKHGIKVSHNKVYYMFRGEDHEEFAPGQVDEEAPEFEDEDDR
ncbi:MAG: hypothetical protein Q7P63_12445 [Verrucomicrobiota bacterium JB022]|nr:hypothetical protein [Verrucomicrobiota bacterium JB022]